jgi:periplasmic protein TonB
MIELSQKRIVVLGKASVTPRSQQSRLVIALVLLLAALAGVLIKDRQFWFGSEQTIADANDYQAPAPQTQAQSQPQPVAQVPAKPAAPVVPHASVPAVKKQSPVASTDSRTKPTDVPPAVVTNRTVLPPLDVEVIAGDNHRNLHPGSNAQRVQILKPATPVVRQSAPITPPATNAAQHERLAEAITPSYPALAQHMNVQGSVVLEALIASDGRVQNLRVMSGPAILATAAQQAVRDWQFKPVYQRGQAVETRATITVNFTIRVSDSVPNTTLAESRDLTITQ